MKGLVYVSQLLICYMGVNLGGGLQRETGFSHIFVNDSLNRSGSQSHLLPINHRFLITGIPNKKRLKTIRSSCQILLQPNFSPIRKKNHPQALTFADNSKFTSL